MKLIWTIKRHTDSLRWVKHFSNDIDITQNIFLEYLFYSCCQKLETHWPTAPYHSESFELHSPRTATTHGIKQERELSSLPWGRARGPPTGHAPDWGASQDTGPSFSAETDQATRDKGWFLEQLSELSWAKVLPSFHLPATCPPKASVPRRTSFRQHLVEQQQKATSYRTYLFIQRVYSLEVLQWLLLHLMG